jgi:hypothetical protein
MKISWVSACVVLLFSVASAQTPVAGTGNAAGSDWPQFCGPNQNYTSPEKGLLREWPKGGPKVLWKAKISMGWSCPSVMGNDVVVTEYSGQDNGGDKESVVCLDARTGKEKWHYTYDLGGFLYQWYLGGYTGRPMATPTITEKYIYSLGTVGYL